MICNDVLSCGDSSIVACADMSPVQLYKYFDGNGQHIGCRQYLYSVEQDHSIIPKQETVKKYIYF